MLMYEMMNQYAEVILGSIKEKHIEDYEWLLHNRHNIGHVFKQRFRSFWRLNPALLSDDFYDTYFEELQDGLAKGTVDLRALTQTLYTTPSNQKGANKLQFAFCTKLCHTVNPCLPIYDAMIRDFYFYSEPNRKLPLSVRIEDLMFFYQFLTAEYRRIISENLLQTAITSFLTKFRTSAFTAEKVIDSLIWAFVGLMKSGAIVSKAVTYR